MLKMPWFVLKNILKVYIMISSQSALLFFVFSHAMLQSHEAETLGTLTVYLHSVFE